MTSVSFFIFRHGETDWNRLTRFQGHTDIPLNQLGREQAASLQPVLQALKPQKMLCSDLIRAKETAALVNQPDSIPVLYSPELRECNLGKAEGLLRDVVIETFGESVLQKWRDVSANAQDFGFPGGETKRQHLERLLRELTRASCAEPTIERWAVSTHGGSLVRLVHHCENAPATSIQIQNCSLYEIRWEPTKNRWLYIQRHH